MSNIWEQGGVINLLTGLLIPSQMISAWAQNLAFETLSEITLVSITIA